VSQSPDPVPQRIGDAERDQAAGYLREALAEGRLDQSEFDERLERALQAKTQADLDPLFRDLPGPRPGQGMATSAGFQAPPWQRREGAEPASADVVPSSASADVVPAGRSRVLDTIAWVAWPVTIMVLFATSWSYWWLIFIPIIISSLAGSKHQRSGRDRGH
jgi:DUF1707 SHOCT-like domain